MKEICQFFFAVGEDGAVMEKTRIWTELLDSLKRY
jgi:hypothetical protein